MNITLIHAGIALAMSIVHYPVAKFYVERVLSGLSQSQQDALRASVAPALGRVFWVWLVVNAALCGVFVASRMDETVVRIAMGAMIMGFHAIWWPFVVPVIYRLQRELKARGLERGIAPKGAIRSASLAPRQANAYLSGWMRALPVVLGVVGVVTIVWRLIRFPLSDPELWLVVCTFGASGVLFLVVWGIWVRREITQPYLMEGPPQAVQERMDDAEALRRYRVRGIYWLQIAAALVFFGSAIAVIEVNRGALTESTVGLVGGLAGTAVGLAGAVFGTLASIRSHHAMREQRPPSAHGPTA